jgi:hypothetical protein
MDPGRINSEGWTGDIESQTAPGNRWEQQPARYVPWNLSRFDERTPDQSHAQLHAILVMAVPLLLFPLDTAMLAGFPSDFRTAEPPITLFFVIAAILGVTLLAIASYRAKAARACRVIGKVTWLTGVAACFAYFFIGLSAHGGAATGPVQRAQILDSVYERSTGYRAPSYVRRKGALFLLQDGTQLTTIDYPAGRNCFAVQRVEGRFGFAWLRIVDRLPGSVPGLENWPVDRAACFSATPLAALRASRQ